MIGLLMIAPLITFYALRLGGTPSSVGPLFSAFAVAQLLASPIWGRVSDRYGRRPVLLSGLFASAVAYLIFGFAGSLWLLFVCRFVQGFGGGTTGVAQAYVADTMAPGQRAKALGWLSAATSLGVSIGAVVGSVTHKVWGPHGLRIRSGGPGAAQHGVCVSWLPESRVYSPAPRDPDSKASGSFTVIINNVTRPLWQVIAIPPVRFRRSSGCTASGCWR
jgi:multidrug resistance protein